MLHHRHRRPVHRDAADVGQAMAPEAEPADTWPVDLLFREAPGETGHLAVSVPPCRATSRTL